MAAFEITSDNAPYFAVRVYFLNLQFDQIIVIEKTGEERTIQMQAYADLYETEWVNA